MEYAYKREDLDFYSKGTRCAAWFYMPETENKPPVIVMAHGLGGTRELRLYEYAERFAAAGYAVYLFDYLFATRLSDGVDMVGGDGAHSQ